MISWMPVYCEPDFSQVPNVLFHTKTKQNKAKLLYWMNRHLAQVWKRCVSRRTDMGLSLSSTPIEEGSIPMVSHSKATMWPVILSKFTLFWCLLPMSSCCSQPPCYWTSSPNALLLRTGKSQNSGSRTTDCSVYLQFLVHREHQFISSYEFWEHSF